MSDKHGGQMKLKLTRVRLGQGGTVKKLSISAAIVLGLAGAANAADMPIPTKAWTPPAAVPAACTGLTDFLLSNCLLSWYGVTFYGTVDMGGTYQTHGTPFDPNFPTGASYFLNPTNRSAGFGLGPNAMSQSNVGVKIIEPIAGGWSFVSQNELAFDPYSGLLANAPQALQNAIGVPQTQQLLPVDSSRWGWLAGTNAAGVSSPVYGTLLFGRQNSLLNDAVVAYDPMGAAYAFSPIGYSGKVAGAGDTEEARWTTAIKYRVNIGDFRLAVEGQPIGGSTGGYDAYNPNNGAISGGIGGDIKNVVPGVISLDVFGTFEKDAVNIGTNYAAGPTLNSSGLAIGNFQPAFLTATVSNQTSVMAVGKWSFGSWGNTPPPVVGKAAPAPSGPSGIPLTLYGGYEWVQYANPSDPQSSFNDDGFSFLLGPSGVNGHGQAAGGNNTSINNNAYNSNCGKGAGCTDQIFQVFWVGAKYGITKNLDVIGAYYHYDQDQFVITTAKNECANPTQLGQCAGTGDMASAVLDWRFLPKWDAYIGTFYSTFGGGLVKGYLASSNLATTSGVRFRF